MPKINKQEIRMDFSIPINGVWCKIEVQWACLDRISFHIITPGVDDTRMRIVSHDTFLTYYWKYRRPKR